MIIRIKGNNCPFCQIIKQEIERIVKVKNHVFVILSNPRLIPGHLLVIPRRHVEKLSELDKEELDELLATVMEYQEKILQFASGCDICQHYRPFIKQNRVKVDHLHIHLRPREFEDELYLKSQKFQEDVWQDLSDKERDRFIGIYK